MMKTITQTWMPEKVKNKGVIAFICRNLYSILSTPFTGQLSYRETIKEAIEVDRDAQFKAYVNNRLNILLLWVQGANPKSTESAKQHLGFFLHDMEHHFVDPYAPKEIRDAYRWLKAFVRVYPGASKKDRAQKVYAMIAGIYESLGMDFPLKGRLNFTG